MVPSLLHGWTHVSESLQLEHLASCSIPVMSLHPAEAAAQTEEAVCLYGYKERPAHLKSARKSTLKEASGFCTVTSCTHWFLHHLSCFSDAYVLQSAAFYPRNGVNVFGKTKRQTERKRTTVPQAQEESPVKSFCHNLAQIVLAWLMGFHCSTCARGHDQAMRAANKKKRTNTHINADFFL